MKIEIDMPKALTANDVVKYYSAIGVVGSLANMRCLKKGPKFFKVGRKVIYRPEDIETYLFNKEG